MAPPTNPRDREPPQRITIEARNINADTWPRFLVIEASDKSHSIANINPFIRAKALHGILGVDPKDVILYRNTGILCVEVETRSQSNSLLNAKMFHNMPIVVTPHRTKNSSKGVFHCRDLHSMTEEDILENLESQAVSHIHRIQSKRSGSLAPTDTYIVTFSTPILPSEIKIGSLICKVRIYIPNPRRCFNCQRYGHSKPHCKNKSVCAKCGQEGHEYETCTNDPCCLHCNGAHPASSRECPKWKIEKKILELVHTEKLTFYDARQKANNILPSANRTSRLMSEVVRSSSVETRTIGVQTERPHCATCICSNPKPSSSTAVQTAPTSHDNHVDIIPSSSEDADMDNLLGKRYSPSSDEDEASPLDKRGRSTIDPSAPSEGARGSVLGRPGTPPRRSRSPILPPGRPPDQGSRASSPKKSKKQKK